MNNLTVWFHFIKYSISTHYPPKRDTPLHKRVLLCRVSVGQMQVRALFLFFWDLNLLCLGNCATLLLQCDTVRAAWTRTQRVGRAASSRDPATQRKVRTLSVEQTSEERAGPGANSKQRQRRALPLQPAPAWKSHVKLSGTREDIDFFSTSEQLWRILYNSLSVNWATPMSTLSSASERWCKEVI